MSIPCHAVALRILLSRANITSKIVAAVILDTTLVVAIGAAQRPREARDALDINDICRLMSARHIHGSASPMVFLETDPVRYARGSATQANSAALPQDSADIQASVINGHIQTF